MFIERILNVLMYLSLLALDLILFAIVLVLPTIIVGSICRLFVKSYKDKDLLETIIKFSIFRNIVRTFSKKLLRRK